MSRLKRSRALRRNLRKQARKGTLSARERKTLLQQEKRFRKARRPFMRGLGFGAGLGTGALLVPGVAGLISGLGAIRPGKEAPEDMEEADMIQAGEIKTGAPEDRGLIGDIQVVGEAPDEAMRAVGEEVEGEEEGGEGEEAPASSEPPAEVEEEEQEGEESPAAEEAPAEEVPVPEESEASNPEAEAQARAARAAQRSERAREAGVDAALEAGLGAEDFDVDARNRRRRRIIRELRNRRAAARAAIDAGLGGQEIPDVEIDNPMTSGSDAQLRAAQARGLMRRLSETGSEVGIPGLTLDDGAAELVSTARANRALQELAEEQAFDPSGGFNLQDSRPRSMSPRAAQSVPVDRPDPRMGSTLDPRLPVALGLEPMSEMDRVEMLRRRMAEGGRVDKSNDLVARIKRKYGLR